MHRLPMRFQAVAVYTRYELQDRTPSSVSSYQGCRPHNRLFASFAKERVIAAVNKTRSSTLDGS
jgi:hypothetical protein